MLYLRKRMQQHCVIVAWLPSAHVSSDHELSVLTSLSFRITEPSQSCSCGYLRLRDLYIA